MTTPPAGAYFGNNKYRYVLTFRGGLVLKKAEFISAVHKTDRRDLSGERAALCGAFWEAVAAEPSICAKLKGNITNFINRFAIAVFEEGSFLHLPLDRQRAVVAALQAVYLARDRGDWPRCAAEQTEVVRLTTNAHRGRLPSVAARHALDDRPVPPECAEAKAALHPDLVWGAAALRTAAHAAAERGLPEAAPLLVRDSKYSECSEMRRVVYMSAAIAKFVPSTHTGVPCEIHRREPTRQALLEIGMVDCHVRGKQDADAWDVFLDEGCRVFNMTPARLFGLDYATLEANYVAGKRADVQSGVALKPSRKRPAPREAPARLLVDYPCEFDLVQPGPDDRLLGFKNATVCGTLKEDLFDHAVSSYGVAGLTEGTRVFAKLGESAVDCLFSVECYMHMTVLGMPRVPAAFVTAVFSRDAWAALGPAAGAADGQKWSDAMLRKMDKHSGKAIPMLVCGEFVGERLQNVLPGDPRLASPEYGQTLLRTALLSKRVGAKDFQPFNLMVDAAGRVLQVDLNRADEAQIAKYNTKGLETSRKFGARFWGPAVAYARAHPAELAAFVEQLVAKVPLQVGVKTGLFDADVVEKLKEGDWEQFFDAA